MKLSIYLDGSMVVIYPRDPGSRQFLIDRVPGFPNWGSNSLAIESRYADELIEGMIDESDGTIDIGFIDYHPI